MRLSLYTINSNLNRVNLLLFFLTHYHVRSHEESFSHLKMPSRNGLVLRFIACYFARTAAKHNSVGGLLNRNIFSPSSEAWKSKMQVAAGSLSFESSWEFAGNLFHSFPLKFSDSLQPLMFLGFFSTALSLLSSPHIVLMWLCPNPIVSFYIKGHRDRC